MKKLILQLIILCWATVAGASLDRHFLPVVSNYNDSDYGAMLQNWCAVQDSCGVMHFGNNAGMLSFDGYRWQLSKLPRGTIVRALLCEGDRIYAGTFESFGYFHRDEKGAMRYVPLADSGMGFNMANEEIWSIRSMAGKIYFQSFVNIYSYDSSSGKVEVLQSGISERPDFEGDGTMRPLFCFDICGRLYVQRTNGSFYRYERGGWRRYWHMSAFGSHIMAVSVPDDVPDHCDRVPDGTLIFTQDHLIFRVEDGFPRALRTEIDSELKFCRINRVAEAADGTLYVGTVGNGIFHIDRSGRRLGHFDLSTGLHNNSVLGLCSDSGGNLWATLDDGISLIHTGLPYRILRTGQGGPYLGMVYSVGRHNGHLIVASNQGAYDFDPEAGKFSLIPGTKGQNWCVRSFNGQTFIGGNDCTLAIDSEGTMLLRPISGTDIKKATINGRDMLLQSSYYPLQSYLRDDDGRWQYAAPISGLNAPVRQLEVDADGTIWCSHLTNGVLKAHITAPRGGSEPSVTCRFYPNVSGDSVPAQCFVMKIRGRIVFAQGNGFYVNDEDSDSFRPEDKLNRCLAGHSTVRHAEAVDDSRLWLSCADSYNLVEFARGEYHMLYSIPVSIFPRQSNGDNCSITHFGDTCLFTLNDGLGIVDMASIYSPHPAFRLRIKAIGSYDAQGKFVRLPLKSDEVPVLADNNMQLILSYPNYDHTPYRYRFRIDGDEQSDTLSVLPEMTYTRLGGGSHRLECAVLDPAGKEIDLVCYSFEVLRPWPLRWWAITAYILITMALIALIAHLNTRRSIKRRQREFDEAKAEQDRRIREQALIIAEQQKRLLESELSEKSKELASMALGNYARKQAVENLRASLADQRLKGTPSRNAERVLREISDEGDSRVFWDVFEKNFDLIHEHFFRNLRKAFPALTASDLKFCALLRMNLSTKEISRFTNLSVRGVETARYRLRKKLALASDTSLVQFLIDFVPEDAAMAASRQRVAEMDSM